MVEIVELEELLTATNKDIEFFREHLKENYNNEYALACLHMAQRYRVLIEEKIERLNNIKEVGVKQK